MSPNRAELDERDYVDEVSGEVIIIAPGAVIRIIKDIQLVFARLQSHVPGKVCNESRLKRPATAIEQTFVRFAKIFLDSGEGIEVSVQARFGDEDNKWASWVPIHPLLRPPPNVPTVVLEAFSSRDPEEILEQLFHVLARPKTRPKQSRQQDLNQSLLSKESTGTSNSEKGPKSSATTSQSNVADEKDDRETRILNGLPRVPKLHNIHETQLSNIEEGVTQITGRKWPVEYQAFLRKAMTTTSRHLLCVTKGGRIGQ
ncbi:hypothetical protein CHU98_g8018 [Xylaria longipes]|nr:hypothetical protein CHU98_g8018 [Xylaria longipes]